ncbi:MAG: response regulator [Chloroflexota bacterium]
MSPTAVSILIVDDDEGLAQVVAFGLQSAGFEVHTAHDGVQGYVTYLDSPTDWVLSDIQMPNLDGPAMMRCIRAINPNVQTVYMSGAIDQFRIILDSECDKFGAKYLRKPFVQTDLLKLLAARRDSSVQLR